MDTKRFEVLQLIERRRKWPAEVKARIMEEALAPGITIASVADRHGIARSQVYGWLRKARAGKLPGISLSPAASTAFVPVKVEEAAAAANAVSHRGRGAPRGCYRDRPYQRPQSESRRGDRPRRRGETCRRARWRHAVITVPRPGCGFIWLAASRT